MFIIVCYGLIQLVLLVLGITAWRTMGLSWRIALMLGGVLIILGNLAILDRPWVVALLPVEDLVFWGNVMPLGAGLLAGAAWHHPSGKRWSARILLLALLGFADWSTWEPLVNPGITPTDERDRDGMIRQSTEASCTAAAAANYLALAGIATDEPEMVRQCLTTAKGTSAWGLYRGLSRLARGSGHRVRLTVEPVEAFLARGGPAMVSVKLTPEVDARDPRYRRDWGWLLNQPHSVIVLQQVGERIEVLDPRAGREWWTVQGLTDLWNGTVAWLDPLPPIQGMPAPGLPVPLPGEP